MNIKDEEKLTVQYLHDKRQLGDPSVIGYLLRL